MEVIFEDIARTLNASLVTLPGDPTRSIGYGGPMPIPPGQYRYQAPQLPNDFNQLTVAGPESPAPPLPPGHPFSHPQLPPHPHPHHPAFGHPPPHPPPPPPPRPDSQGPHVFRGPVPPIPPALLAGPRNIERQLA